MLYARKLWRVKDCCKRWRIMDPDARVIHPGQVAGSAIAADRVEFARLRQTRDFRQVKVGNPASRTSHLAHQVRAFFILPVASHPVNEFVITCIAFDF